MDSCEAIEGMTDLATVLCATAGTSIRRGFLADLTSISNVSYAVADL
jgi:hypothetical protein